MQRKKNIKLIITLSSLIILTVFVYSIDTNEQRVGADQQLFTIQDTARINKVVISGPEVQNTLREENNQWLVNDQFILDEGLRQVLLSVFTRIRIQRPVAEVMKEEVISRLKSEGIKIEVYSNQDQVLSFLSAGDRESKVTYFMDTASEEPYIVHLPGYESYVAGLFEITENDWRNRIVMAVDWNVIDELQLSYPGESNKGFTIAYDDNTFKLKEVSKADTSALFSYMDNVSYILTDQYINAEDYPRYDSLSYTSPFAVLSVKEIGESNPARILFYPPLENENMILGKVGDDQLALFDLQRISYLFKTPNDFKSDQE